MDQPVLNELMALAGRPPPTADQVEITAGDPVNATALPVDRAAAEIIAAVGLAAAELWELRSGEPQRVVVAQRRAGAALTSFAFLRGAVAAEALKKLGARRQAAALTRFFPTRQGRVIHLHGGFPKLHAGALEVLGLGADADRTAIERVVAQRDPFELEQALAEADVCGAVARSQQEWLDHPQGRVLADTPVVELIKLGDSEPQPLQPGARPLSGIRCLDLTRVLAGPTCARTLAEHGADVLRINAKHVPVIEGFLLDTAAGKRSAWLDVREPEARSQLLQLVREGDIFSQGYRASVMQRFGLTPEILHEERPGIIYVSINCYGHEGPWHARPGWEQLAQTASGIAVSNGTDGPTLLPCAATDYGTGYLAAFGAMVALRRRATEGGSYHVRVSLARTAMCYLAQPRTDAPARALDDAERAAFSTTSQTAAGELTHLAPVVQLERTPARWSTGPVAVGSHPARWW